MAQKRKPTPKKNTRSRKPSSKGKTTARAKKPSSPAKKTSSRSKVQQPQDEPIPSLWASLPLDRKLDIIGVVMAVVGLVTLFGLLSVNNGWLMGVWVTSLSRLFGWGVYMLPLGLMLFGGWLVLRKFERFPRLSPERALGSSLLFLLLLVAMLYVPYFVAEYKRQVGIIGKLLEQAAVHIDKAAGAGESIYRVVIDYFELIIDILTAGICGDSVAQVVHPGIKGGILRNRVAAFHMTFYHLANLDFFFRADKPFRQGAAD